MHPVLFEVGGLTVYSYGVCTQLSYAAFAGLLIFTANRLGEALDTALRIGAGMLAGGLIGGRLGFILINLNEPGIMRVLFDLSGSFVMFAALIGGVLGPMVMARQRSRPVGTGLDLVTPPMLGAWAVSNLGCFLAGCCWGPTTQMPWGVRFLSDILPPELRGVPVHPTQLYSFGSDLLVLVLVLGWPRGAPGTMFLGGLLGLVSLKLLLIATGVGHGGAMLAVFPVLAASSIALLIALRNRPIVAT